MKSLYLLLCCLVAVSAVAQDIQYVDKSGRPAEKKKAAAMIVSTRVNDTCWEKNYYKKFGPCFLSVRYKDANASIQHGRYVKFGRDGCADSLGYYANGKKEGLWTVPGDNCRTLYALQYKDDKLISVTDSTQLGIERNRRRDSALRLNPADTAEIESEFPGGPRGWQVYLNKNLRYPQEAIDDEVMGEVNVAFIVKADGSVEDPFIWKSADYYLDKESLRIIIKSQQWVPAQQFGKKVKSYKIQPVVYRLERG
jgi:periplasmic protein TonB